jgi:hypothetical protein
MKKKYTLFVVFLLNVACLSAQDTVHYSGTVLSDVNLHHGQLSPAMGVHNIQTMRANRADDGVTSWTYNHAPMMAYWNNTFFLEYLSNPIGEHIAPGQTLLQSSKDGYHWSYPTVIFPPYKIPDGFVKAGKTDTAKNAFAVMHQRIGFYTSSTKRLFALAYYGIALGNKDDPNDGNGIGRVIREIKNDGSFGPIYFLRYNHSFNENNTTYPFYKSSKDKGLIAACEEILHTPLLMLQMVEEADRDDPLIPLKKDFKAFNYYHLPNGNVVGLWKYALTSISKDEGKTWVYSPLRAPGFVNANAKIWGQRSSDGKFATVYNPSEFRWPLAISTSDDGLNYKNLMLVHGEITTMRYGGAYKSYGPQYVRGIQEMDGKPNDGNLWVTYSVNKEDIWVSKIPVPIKSNTSTPVNDVFNRMLADTALNQWNTYSPIWCKVAMENYNNQNCLTLHDKDPFDFAKAERLFPAAKQTIVEFGFTAMQSNFGNMDIELQDKTGKATLRISLDSSGNIITKQGYRYKTLGKYIAGERCNIKIEINTSTRFYNVTINNGKPSVNICFQPVETVERLVFRTGAVRKFPDADTPTDQAFDVQNPNSSTVEAIYRIHFVQTTNQQNL